MPAQSETTQERGFGPFVTFVVRKRPDGVIAHWESRAHRKHLHGAKPRGSTWWAPRDRDWWMGVLFAVGSFLFALGTVPGYVDAVGARPDAVTFFIGSLFFTSAGFLQYREAVDAAPRRPGTARRKVFVFLPDRIDWHATAVQLGGHHRVQRQHVRRHLGGRRLHAGTAPCLAARRPRLGLLPGRQRARLVRGVPRLDGLAAEIAGLVDHRGEPGRVGRVRVLRRRQLRRSRNCRVAERPGGQPRYLHRRAVLPGRRGAPALRADRRGTCRHGSAAAVRPGAARPAVTGRGTSSGRSGPSRNGDAGSRRPA